METSLFTQIIQVIIAIGIFNVWIINFNKPTKYRGAGAKNIKDEFKAYGLPLWSVYLVGSVKIAVAMALLLGLIYPSIVPYVGYILLVLMLSAIFFHVKISDPLYRAIPSLIMLFLALLLVI